MTTQPTPPIVPGWNVPTTMPEYQAWWNALSPADKTKFTADMQKPAQPTATPAAKPAPKPTETLPATTATATGTAVAHSERSTQLQDDLTHGLPTGIKRITVIADTMRLPSDPPNQGRTELDVVIVGAARHPTKTYYANPYVPGSKTPPDCQSGDSITPHAVIKTPQHPTCADCPHNQFESARTGSGKACATKKVLAVAPPAYADKMVYKLSIPPTGLTPLGEYLEQLAARGLTVDQVITKVSLVPSGSFHKFSFSFVAVLDAETLAKVDTMITSGEPARVCEYYASERE